MSSTCTEPAPGLPHQGSVPPLLSTAWGQRFSLDLYSQYWDAGAPADFVATYCKEAAHADWCTAAEAAMAAWPR